jgi:OOP family OmpA-OmpF porin
MFPINQQFSVYGKLGFYRGEAKLSGDAGDGKETNTDLTYGVGVQYNFNPKLGVRGEWQRYTKVGGDDVGGDADVDVSVGRSRLEVLIARSIEVPITRMITGRAAARPPFLFEHNNIRRIHVHQEKLVRRAAGRGGNGGLIGQHGAVEARGHRLVCRRLRRSVQAADICTGIPGCDDKDTAYKIFGGYQVNRNFALEGGYTDLGKATVNVTGPGGFVNAEFKANAWEVVGVGMLPVADRFSIFGKIGLYRAELKGTVSSNVLGTTPLNGKDTNTDLTFGVGLKFDITNNFALRGEWQRYSSLGGSEVGESDVDVLSVGVAFKF